MSTDWLVEYFEAKKRDAEAELRSFEHGGVRILRVTGGEQVDVTERQIQQLRQDCEEYRRILSSLTEDE
jgi:hypothetical protein